MKTINLYNIFLEEFAEIWFKKIVLDNIQDNTIIHLFPLSRNNNLTLNLIKK